MDKMMIKSLSQEIQLSFNKSQFMKYPIIVCTLVVLLFSSCRSTKMNKMLLYHSSQLEQLVKKDIPAPDKIDVLAALMVEALEESLEFKKTKDSVKFLKSYTAQNKESVNAIYGQVATWYSGLSPSMKLVETTRLATKPYVRQLLHVAPMVEKKIKRKLKTVFFMHRFLSLLKL